jgi:hypothetical protein
MADGFGDPGLWVKVCALAEGAVALLFGASLARIGSMQSCMVEQGKLLARLEERDRSTKESLERIERSVEKILNGNG